ncbi:MAG: hypothetical protein ABEJ79_00580 [Halolamina sp.]
MDSGSLRLRLAAYPAGALVAGSLAGLLTTLGAGAPPALVVGLAAAVPFVELADHRDEVATDERARHAAAVVAGGLAAGGAAVALLAIVAPPGIVALGLAAAATYSGGAAAGLWRRRRNPVGSSA